jgi:hypothetical protein
VWENIWRKVVQINHGNNASSKLFENKLSDMGTRLSEVQSDAAGSE